MTKEKENRLLLEERFSHLEKKRSGKARAYYRDGREIFRVEDSGRLRLPPRSAGTGDLLRSFPYRVDEKPDGPSIPLDEVREMDRVYALIESAEAVLREENEAGITYRAPKRRLRLPSSRFLKGILLFSALLLFASFLILSYALSRESIVSDRELSIERLLGR